MMQSRLMNILRSPVVSEKSNSISEHDHCLTFKVLPDATKPEIKAAVENLLNVKVEAVRTLNVRGKKRRTAHGFGYRSDWKKAYVTLKADQNYDLGAQLAGKESN